MTMSTSTSLSGFHGGAVSAEDFETMRTRRSIIDSQVRLAFELGELAANQNARAASELTPFMSVSAFGRLVDASDARVR